MLISNRCGALIGVLSALAVVACGDDDDGTPVEVEPEAGVDAGDVGDDEADEAEDEADEADEAEDEADEADEGDDDSMPEGGMPPPVELPEFDGICDGLDGTELEECGGYIVNNLFPCGDCHTPRDAMGIPIEGMHLAGNPIPFFDLDPEDDEVGGVWSRNLTPDEETGLGGWSDDEIKDAFLNGVRPDGSAVFPVMPYNELHNMADIDADAIVAYLRTIPAVDNEIPASQIPLPAPFPPLNPEGFPLPQLDEDDDDYDAAMRGMYIATFMGACVGCHTPRSEMGALDESNFLTGGGTFASAAFGLPPLDTVPEMIFSRNLTPHEDGLAGWTATAIRNALIDGVDDEGQGICPPMPAGPFGPFAGMEEDDALALAAYLLNIEGKPNSTGEPYPECSLPLAPPPPMGDGGMSMEGGPGPVEPEAGPGPVEPEAGPGPVEPEAGPGPDPVEAGAPDAG